MFGDIYEKLLKDLQSAGNAGEFYTPRAVTQFIVEQVDPRLSKRETILDPACGTGGFLTCVIEHLRKRAKTAEYEAFLQDCFSGIEKKHLPHVLCMTNLLLHGIDVPSNVWHDNPRPPASRLVAQRTRKRYRHQSSLRRHGGGRYRILRLSFALAKPPTSSSCKMMKVLKPGGRAGLVSPDGTLFGEGVKTRIKETLLTECNLHTIVRLPNGIFNPYTGICTNLLFFTKGQPTTAFWYYEHPYRLEPRAITKASRFAYKSSGPERKWWKKRVESEQAWPFSVDQIKQGNYNLDLKDPNTPDAVLGDVDHLLLPAYEKLLAQIAETRTALNNEVHRPLTILGGKDA